MRRSTPGRGGAQVRVDVERAPQRDQALLGTDGGAFELRQPDGAEQHGVCARQAASVALGQRRPLVGMRGRRRHARSSSTLERERASTFDRDGGHLRARFRLRAGRRCAGQRLGLKGTLQAATEVPPLRLENGARETYMHTPDYRLAVK